MPTERRSPIALKPAVLVAHLCCQLAPVNWTSQAESRLKEVPFFVRPIVRKRIESLAAEAGRAEVDEAFYEQAKAQFGQK